MAQALAAISSVVGMPQFRKVVKPKIAQLVALCIRGMQLTKESESRAQRNPNAFVAEGMRVASSAHWQRFIGAYTEEDESAKTVRQFAADVIGELLEMFGSKALEPIATVAITTVKEAAQAGGGVPPWKLEEASMR